MRRLMFLLPVGLFLALARIFAFSLRPGHDPHVLPSAMIDREAPVFDLPTLTGTGRLGRETLKGQPVVVNFFASWSVPCRIEHPILMRLAQRDHIQLYGIAYKDKVEDSAKLLNQFGDPYRGVGVDRDGRTGLDFGVYGVPETYVIDANGRIRKRFVGPMTAETADNELLPLLRKLGGS